MNDIINKETLVGEVGTTISTITKPYVVGVIFDRGFCTVNRVGIIENVYSYLCDIENVQIGDKVIVDAPNEGFVVVSVVSVQQYDKKATEYVVAKLDVTEYEARKERQLKKAQLKALLDAAAARLDQEAKLASYAATDEQFAAIYNEYKSL